MNRRVSVAFLIAATVLVSSCGKKDEERGAGTFPNFYALAKEAVPATSSSSGSALDEAVAREIASARAARAAVTTFPTTYTTSSSDFSTAFSTSQNYIGQVLLDAGTTGPVKSMFVLLAQAQSTMEGINAQYSDASGNPANCTAIAAGASLTTPFFSSATNAPFNAWTDTGKYTCYATRDNGLTAFGRHAIAAPSAGCTDAYEYYVMTGYAMDDQPNTSLPETRGSTVDGGSIQKFYYNGCSKDLKLAYAQTTKYSAGVEFTSRSEITGNAAAHTFSIRANYIDADTTWANHITVAGTGTSKVATGSSGSANFIMGYRSDNCGTAANSSSCSENAPAKTFCAKNSGTGSDYELDATTTNCQSLEAAYAAIDPLVRSDLPNGYFAVTAASFGL